MPDPRANLILTVDYELFGDGGGDLDAHLVQPTDRLLRVARAHGVPVTIFVETEEIRFLEAHAAPGSALAAQVERVRAQLRQAVADGHDVQLHVHPQWMDATWNGESARVREDAWRLGDLDAAAVGRLLGEGKAWLEACVAEARPGHRCDVFRAGAWCIQPERDVLATLRRLGFRMESTVAPGLSHPGRLDWYDFADAPTDRSWWRIDVDVCRPEDGALVEVPIVVARVPRLRGLQAIRHRLRGGGGMGPVAGGGGLALRARASALRGFLPRWRRLKLDPCALPAPVLLVVLRRWLRERDGAGVTPVVAILHSKSFSRRSERELDAFLRWAGEQPNLRASTYAGWWADAGLPVADQRASGP